LSKKQQKQYYEELAKNSIQKKISPRLSMGRSLRNQIRKMKKILELGQFKSKDLILDLGCGECLELIALKGKSIEIIAVDLSSNLLKISINLTREYNIKADFVNADSEHLPFKSNIFHHSFCIALLHHVSDPLKAINEMKRVTRRQGHVVIVEANLLNPICWIEIFKNWALEKGVFRVTKKRLVKLLKTSELKKLTIEMIVSKPDRGHIIKNLLRNILEILKRSRRARKIISSTYVISSTCE
jgi:ubiquinone/menaquinone biosynthesis C-methylase UbiE